MVETKYGQYIIRAPLAENKYPPHTPCLFFESGKYFPQLNFSFRYTYLDQPVRMAQPHSHDFDQFLCFLGKPEDLKVFDGEVELSLGEEGTKNTIDVTSVMYVPRGLVHGPVSWKRVNQPMMFINCALTPRYSQESPAAASGGTAPGAGGQDAGKYEQYFIKEPYSWNILPPYGARLLFDSHNYFPETNFGIRYTYLTQPREMEHPHAHDFAQLLTNFGPPEDLRLYDAEAEVYLGEEGEKHVATTPHITYVPAGLIHGPSIARKMNKPVLMVNFIFTSQYTRSDQQDGFLNYLELNAQEVTPAEATRRLGAAVPLPAYLPEGCRIRETYAQDESLRLIISDKAVDKDLITLGDATGSRQRYHFTCQMEMEVKWHPGGLAGGLKAAGQPITFDGIKGVRIFRESNIELVWLLSPTGVQRQGQYEIALRASQNIKDELFKVARSVTV